MAADGKNLDKYYRLEEDVGLHQIHRRTIRVFNRLSNGNPEGNLPGIRNIVVGRELERVATSAILGLLSVSDVNPGFVHRKLVERGDKLVEEIVEQESVLVAGNILLTGLPGGGKTLLARSLAALCSLTFNAVQMTPDLTPRDLVVKTIMVGGNRTVTKLGPAFAHVLLADEINRATPKTQSALLQRMSSGIISYDDAEGRDLTRVLPQPSFTMATRNPIEDAGTNPLPEAQLDRFLYNILLDLPSAETMKAVMREVPAHAKLVIKALTSQDELIECRNFIFEQIEFSEKMRDYIVRLLLACRNPFEYGLFPELKNKLSGEELILLSPNSRAALHLMNSAKTLACVNGERLVAPDHIKKRFYEAVNHRFVINKRSRNLLQEYGGVDNFLRLMIKGGIYRNKQRIPGLLDIVPVEG